MTTCNSYGEVILWNSWVFSRFREWNNNGIKLGKRKIMFSEYLTMEMEQIFEGIPSGPGVVRQQLFRIFFSSLSVKGLL